MIEKPPTETGRTERSQNGCALVHAGGKTLHGEVVAHVEPEHGIGHAYGNLMAGRGTSVKRLEAGASLNVMLTRLVTLAGAKYVCAEGLGWLGRAMRRHGGRRYNEPGIS